MRKVDTAFLRMDRDTRHGKAREAAGAARSLGLPAQPNQSLAQGIEQGVEGSLDMTRERLQVASDSAALTLDA